MADPINRSRRRSALELHASVAGPLAFGGPQSALDPAGTAAELTAELMVWLASGAALIWVAVIAVSWYAIRVAPGDHSERHARRFLVLGGVVFPVITLTVLLTFSLKMTPGLLASGHGIEIAVIGEQYWWRVRYRLPDGTTFETANELWLPVGERVELRLSTADVIHSFWVPSLGGKMDMVPGRVNRFALEPTRVGTYRGACAEFCGESHALMAFNVVVAPRAEFERWLQVQQSPAGSPRGTLQARGQRLFLDNGCGACHRVAGTPANGAIGPDLTHVGARTSLAAGVLPMTRQAAARWLAHTNAIKPDVAMPAYDMLSEEELLAIATYLEALE